ncbi:MAG: hypothetical protein HQL32_12545 [Planctomycetes bacterium]|nr:hypothetical protein [Planctomycetota bacterium]
MNPSAKYFYLFILFIFSQVGVDSLYCQHISESVFYQVYIRGYKDSNGDGIGDFRGLASKIPYIKSLGIGALWLMPVNRSIDRDHGYAVIDYYDVETDYGTMEDFEYLLDVCRKHDLRVILDMVVNHSSIQSVPFQGWYKGTSHDDFFVSRPKNDPEWVNHHGHPVWHQYNRGYYYGLFHRGMPDFNYHNPKVINYFEKILDFWLARGVAGFRFDAIQHLVEGDRELTLHHPLTHEVIRRFNKVISSYPNTFSVGEVTDSAKGVDYFAREREELDSVFDFKLAESIVTSVKENDPASLNSYLKNQFLPEHNRAGGHRFSLFLSNHDRFAGDRVMTQLAGEVAKAKLCARILLTLPGVPFIYYGEEIGMTNYTGRVSNEDHALRSPMQWSAKYKSSFTMSENSYRPIARSYQHINVEIQNDSRESLLNTYRRMIEMRNESKALKGAEMYMPAEVKADNLLAYWRKSGGESLLIYHNLSASEIDIDLNMNCLNMLNDKGHSKGSKLNLPAFSSAILSKEI